MSAPPAPPAPDRTWAPPSLLVSEKPESSRLGEGWGAQGGEHSPLLCRTVSLWAPSKNSIGRLFGRALTCRQVEDRREGIPGQEGGRAQTAGTAASGRLWRGTQQAGDQNGLRRATGVLSTAGGSLRRMWGQGSFEDGRPCLWWREGHGVVTGDRLALTATFVLQ